MKQRTESELLVSHVLITCENYLSHSRSNNERLDKIEQEYIKLTGKEIEKHPFYNKLLKKRESYLGINQYS